VILRAEPLETNDENRVLAFLRSDGYELILVVATVANPPRPSGMFIHHPSLGDGSWREIFNSDAAVYGDDNVPQRRA
jgi:1,4-alpha-glucan branching enzyme